MPKQKAETQEELLGRYLQLVYGLALFCTGGPVQADAVCMKTFFDYYRQDPVFFREESRKSWFVRHIVRICRKNVVGISKEPERKNCFCEKVENDLFLKLCGFPYRYRVLLYLSLFSGMSCEEIGRCLHKQEGTVRSQLIQAKKRLYVVLASLGIEMEDSSCLISKMKDQITPSGQSVTELLHGLKRQQQRPSAALRAGKIAFASFLCLLVVTLAAGIPKLLIRPPVVPSVFPTQSSQESSEEEDSWHWNQLGISEQYPEVSLGGEMFISRVHKISIEQIGTLLSTVEMVQTDEKKRKHKINAELYEIKKISTRCAIAVHYEGYDGFYVFVNPSYQPNTLGDLIEDLNLKETMTFGNVYYSGLRDGDYVQIEYLLENLPEIVWDMLLSTPEMPLSQDREYGEEWLAISINLSDFGYENIALSITKDGYLQTNLLETGKIFYIGEEKAEAFAKYIYQHAKSRNLSLGSGTVDKSHSSYSGAEKTESRMDS